MNKEAAKNLASTDMSIFPLVIVNQKNLGRFLTDSDVPQIVCLHVKESKFLVNSVVLCLHSSVFEEQILKLTSDNHTLFLDDDLLGVDDIEGIVRDCLTYLHGEEIKVTYSNVHRLYKFASVYKISPLISSCKCLIDKHLSVQKLLENYSDDDSAVKNLIEKNCGRIIRDILSLEGSPIICGLKKNVEFLRFLVESSSLDSRQSSECKEILGNFLLLLARTEKFDCSFLLDFPLDKLDYKTVFPIFEDFQKFIELLVTSVKDPVKTEHKAVLKRLCLVSRLLGNNVCPRSELKPNVTADVSSLMCSDEPSEVTPIVTTGNETTSIDAALSDSRSPLRPDVITGISTKLENEEDPTIAADPEFLVNFLGKSPSDCSNEPDKILKDKCIELDYHVKRNVLGDYYRVELFLGWVLSSKLELDVDALERFLKTFNFKRLNKTFFEDTWSFCSLFYESFKLKNQYLDKLADDDNFFVIQRKLSQADIRESIQSSGNVLLPGNSSCLLTRCDGKSHIIGQISIKLRVSQEDQSYGLVRKNQHQKYLEHYYMTLHGKDMSFSGLVSLKILTKTDILAIVDHYSYFCITLIYNKNSLFVSF